VVKSPRGPHARGSTPSPKRSRSSRPSPRARAFARGRSKRSRTRWGDAMTARVIDLAKWKRDHERLPPPTKRRRAPRDKILDVLVRGPERRTPKDR
jgi:hypothetical protein